MVAMVGQGDQGEMPPISMPWLPTGTPINTTLSLTVGQAGWVERLAVAEPAAMVGLEPMAETAFHAVASLATEEMPAMAQGAETVVMAEMEAWVERAAQGTSEEMVAQRETQGRVPLVAGQRLPPEMVAFSLHQVILVRPALQEQMAPRA